MGDTTSASAVRCAGPLSAPVTGAGEPSAFVIACPPGTHGSYVTVRHVGAARYLTLLEVEAYASPGRASAGMPARTAGAEGHATDVQTATATSALIDVPAFEEVTPPVIETSNYWDQEVRQGVNDGVDEVAGASEPKEEGGGAHPSVGVVAVALSVPLALALMCGAGSLAWALHLRRRLPPKDSASHAVIMPAILTPEPSSSSRSDAVNLKFANVARREFDSERSPLKTDVELQQSRTPMRRNQSTPTGCKVCTQTVSCADPTGHLSRKFSSHI